MLSYRGANRRVFGAGAGHSEPASQLPDRIAKAQKGLDDALARQKRATESLRETVQQFRATMIDLGVYVAGPPSGCRTQVTSCLGSTSPMIQLSVCKRRGTCLPRPSLPYEPRLCFVRE